MALRFDIVLDQGSDYRVTFPVLDPTEQPQDLAGWSARSQVRRTATDATVLHDFTTQLVLSSNGIQLTVPGAVSSVWAWTSAEYDLEVVSPSGAPTRIAEGHVLVRPETTR
jgi:hypothetical protein